MNPIEIEHLVHRYGRNEAVHDLTLSVPEGSVTALLGPNGAGKTTTLKVLVNLLRAASGSARVLGVDSRRLGPRELARIGYVAEDQQQPDWMTVRQFLDYCRPFYPTWDRALELTLLEQFELPPDRKLRHLSRGMRMKAVLLSSLAYRPELLVLDEPFSGLDPVVREDFVRGVLEVANRGAWTVLVSSHDIEEVERLCDHIAMIDSGRLRLAESTESLLTRFRRVDVTLAGGETPSVQLGPEGTWLGWRQEGERICFVETRFGCGSDEPTLRERFPGALVAVQSMTLREIYIALHRHGRKGASERAA